MRKLLVVMLVAALPAVLAAQALAATRSVKVGDDYFVRKGSRADRHGQEGHQGHLALARP